MFLDKFLKRFYYGKEVKQKEDLQAQHSIEVENQNLKEKLDKEVDLKKESNLKEESQEKIYIPQNVDKEFTREQLIEMGKDALAKRVATKNYTIKAEHAGIELISPGFQTFRARGFDIIPLVAYTQIEDGEEYMTEWTESDIKSFNPDNCYNIIPHTARGKITGFTVKSDTLYLPNIEIFRVLSQRNDLIKKEKVLPDGMVEVRMSDYISEEILTLPEACFDLEWVTKFFELANQDKIDLEEYYSVENLIKQGEEIISKMLHNKEDTITIENSSCVFQGLNFPTMRAKGLKNLVPLIKLMETNSDLKYTPTWSNDKKFDPDVYYMTFPHEENGQLLGFTLIEDDYFLPSQDKFNQQLNIMPTLSKIKTNVNGSIRARISIPGEVQEVSVPKEYLDIDTLYRFFGIENVKTKIKQGYSDTNLEDFISEIKTNINLEKVQDTEIATTIEIAQRKSNVLDYGEIAYKDKREEFIKKGKQAIQRHIDTNNYFISIQECQLNLDSGSIKVFRFKDVDNIIPFMKALESTDEGKYKAIWNKEMPYVEDAYYILCPRGEENGIVIFTAILDTYCYENRNKFEQAKREELSCLTIEKEYPGGGIVARASTPIKDEEFREMPAYCFDPTYVCHFFGKDN